TKTIADRTAPRVWESWKSMEEVYLPDGKADGTPPKDWSEPGTNRVCKNSAELDPALTKILADLNQGDDNGAGIGPHIGQNRTHVRYEIRTNKAKLAAINPTQLYLRAKLPPQDPNGAPAPLLPNGPIDVKAAWRDVRAGENTDRYYQTEGWPIDPA